MAALVCHASSSSFSACAAAEEWGDLSDEEQFIQEDASVPASIEHSEADSEDVLEALIQAELAKFQQQQAEKYAALLSEGQAVLPLPSPAPHQQQLRAQQKQQEALVDAASFEEQERLEYVPSARSTLDAEQLMRQHSACMPSNPDSCSRELQLEQQEQPARPDQLCSEPASTTSVGHAEACPAVLADGPYAAITEPDAAEPQPAALSSQATEEATDAAGCSTACMHEGQGGVLAMPPAECSPAELQPQGSTCQLDVSADSSAQQLQETVAAGCAAASTCADPDAAHSTTDCAAPLVSDPSTADQAAADQHHDACDACAEPAVAELGGEHHTEPMLQQSMGPAQTEYVLQELSKLQLQPTAELSSEQEHSGVHAPSGAADANADAEACALQESVLLSQPPPEPSDSAVECPELPVKHLECLQEHKLLQQQLQLQQDSSEQQHADTDQQAQQIEQQHEEQGQEQQQEQQQSVGVAQQDGQACEPEPEVLSRSKSETACAQPASAEPPTAAAAAASPEAAAAAASLAADAAAGCSSTGPEAEGSENAEGFIYQDEDQADSPGNPASPVRAANLDSWQAAAARTSEDASAAAAAAFAAMSIAAAGAGELSPWETCAEDNVCSSTQHGPASGSCGQSQDSSSRLSPRLRQQSPRQQQVRQHQQQPPQPPQSPRQPSPRHQPAQPQQLPGPSRALNRPSSAPVGDSRPHVTLTGPAAAQLALRQSIHAAGGAAGALPDRMPVVAESSREGPCSSRGLPGRQPAPYQPIASSPMQFYQGAAATSEWTANMHHQQHYNEEQYQQVVLARMQQLQQPPSRPVSADPWRRSRSQPRGQRMAAYEHQQQQQQQQQRQRPQQRQSNRRSGQAWDDSPMPLHIPRWVPIAQAVQLPSTTVAANASYCGWGNSSLGSTSILGGSPSSRVAWVPDSIRADAGGRPQTAGPVMVDNSNHSRAWQSAQLLLHDRSGCLTARSACSSPSRMRSAMLPIPPVTPSGAAAYGYDPMAVDGFSGLSGFDAGPYAAAQPGRSVSPSAASCCGNGGTTPVGVYLLDVLQQIRQANSYCSQLGLSTQYKLAEGSSKKDKWQLEQIEVELWTVASSYQQAHGQGQEQYQQQWTTVNECAGGECQWQLRKVLSLPQFKAHLNRLKGSTPTGGVGPVGPTSSAAVRSSISPYAANPAGGYTAAGVRPGSAAAAAAAAAQHGGLLSQRPLSPDRYRVHAPGNASSQVSAAGGSVSAVAGGRRASSTSRGSRMNRTGSASTSQLLVLSPRGSGSGEQVHRLVRPASAPRGYTAGRISPPRR